MTSLANQVNATLTLDMVLPEPLVCLFKWIEDNGFFIHRDEERIGFLYSDKKLKEEWTNTERSGGTHIEFHSSGNTNLQYWFGKDDPTILNRLCVFAQTGSDGSMAQWLHFG